MGRSAIFLPPKLVIGPKVPQNGLKLETVTNKSCGACDKVHVHQISSYLVNLCGHNRTKCPKTTIFLPRKWVLGSKVPQNGLKLKKVINKYWRALDKVYLVQISINLVKPLGHNLKYDTCTTHFFIRKNYRKSVHNSGFKVKEDTKAMNED